MKIRLPESMTKFRCNQKGCCCKGWTIPFDPEDVAHLLVALAEGEREAVMEKVTMVTNAAREIVYVQLRTEGPERACQFLATSGQCGLQVARGVEILPNLCRAFPAFATETQDATELHYDAMCPEVLTALDESEEPLKIIELDVEPDEDLGVRAKRPRYRPPIMLGERELGQSAIRALRRQILWRLSRRDRPLLERLAVIHYAIARVASGSSEFTIRDDDPVASFEEHFETCVGAHDAEVMGMMFWEYRRFVYEISLEDVPWERLTPCMEYSPDWRERLDPRDARYEPLWERYLAHRFFSVYSRNPSMGTMTFTYGNITHALATAMRYTAALAQWLERPVDRPLVRLGLGASEYFYRTVKVPAEAMPWFTPAQAE